MILLAAFGLFPATAQGLQTQERLQVETLETDSPLQSWGRLGGVAVDALGFLYVSNFGESVWRVTPDGAVLTMGDDLYGASGNAVGPDGALYQAEFYRNRIWRFSRSGPATVYAQGSHVNRPIGLTFDPDGDLIVARCDGSLGRITADGEATTWVRSRQLSCTNGLTVGPDSAVYVVAFNHNDVLRVSPEGEIDVLTTLEDDESRGNPGNAHIAFANGWFWVTKLKTHSLWRFRPDGSGAEMLSVENPDQIRYPNGIAAFQGQLWFNVMEGRRSPPSDARLYLRSVIVPPGR